jgi:NAD(P)-dependent dehydrogenase (short-subunit alcohol dehydrogenase family)
MTEAATPPERRVALVTGGSRGIGRAIVEALLEEGWHVASSSLSEDSVAGAREALAARYPGRASARVVDVRDPVAVSAWVDDTISEVGRVDCLVNNAGLGLFGSVDRLSIDEWQTVLRTNLDGAFYAIRAVAPHMRERGTGWILNIASLASRNPFAGGAAYNASKFGLLGLSDAAMLDLRQHGVRVTAILPGSVDTEFSGTSGDASWKLAPQDVARAVLDLLRYPDRALPSRLELRPSRPPK